MTMAEIHQWVAPSKKSISKVKNWLISHESISSKDITDVTSNSDFIKVSTTVGVASEILGCRYLDYVYLNENDHDYGSISLEKVEMTVSRMDKDCDYHVPASVSNHVDFISPTKRFPLVKEIQSKHIRTKQDGASYNVTPAVLKSLYEIGDAVGKASDNSQGVGSFEKNYYSQASLLSQISNFIGFC